MEASLHVPLSISAKNRVDLSKMLLNIQAKENGKITIISIYFDTVKKEHVLWYYPLKTYSILTGL